MREFSDMQLLNVSKQSLNKVLPTHTLQEKLTKVRRRIARTVSSASKVPQQPISSFVNDTVQTGVSYMKKYFGIIITVLFLSVPLLSRADEISQGTQDTIFIGDLKLQPSVMDQAKSRGQSLELKRAMQTLDSQLTSALNATRVFQLVERKRKGDIELEQGFAAVAVDPNDKSAAQAGKMAGAKWAFLPQIDGFEDSTDTAEYQAIGRA